MDKSFKGIFRVMLGESESCCHAVAGTYSERAGTFGGSKLHKAAVGFLPF
jgi:hypothetical protein